MKRWVQALTVTSLMMVVACFTSKPAPHDVSVDPATDPSVVGAVAEAVSEGSAEGKAAAETGRQIGRVAGVIAAVLGGSGSESVDSVVDRYRRTRDAAASTAAVIGGTKGAIAGAKRGYEFDLQFAELHQLQDLDVTRPFPDQIDIHFANLPSEQMLADVAAVFIGREERVFEIEGLDREAESIRESLIVLGFAGRTINTHRNDDVQGVILHIRSAF